MPDLDHDGESQRVFGDGALTQLAGSSPTFGVFRLERQIVVVAHVVFSPNVTQ